MQKIKITNVENIKKLNTDLRYSYQDAKSYFESLEKRKFIKKATYSIVYHPMLLLSKTYNVKIGATGYKHITLKTDHIILLSYLMGYVKDSSGSETFWGSNKTIASDLGVSDRTVQRWLRELEGVDFIKKIIENNSERYIYINFTKILTEIYKCIDDDFDEELTEKACKLTCLCFTKAGYLETTKATYYEQLLYNNYICKLAEKEIIDIMKYLFETLCSLLKVEWEQMEEMYKAAKSRYIAITNQKYPLTKENEV